MPRPSFSDTPLLRVSRPVSACSRCRAAKVKCDGKLPACTACEKAGREGDCSAANDQFARGKERSYVAALELRVEKLERRLAYARSRTESLTHPENDPSFIPPSYADRKDSLAVIRAAMNRKAARKRENSDVNSLVSDFGYLSVNATARDFEPSLSNLTFARLVLAATVNDPLPEPAVLSPKLPTRQTAYALVQYYLTHVHTLFPFFAETSILALLEELYYQHIPGQPHIPQLRSNLQPADYWMLYMVLAIGASSQSRSRQDHYYTSGADFAAHAMPYADGALAPGHVTQIRSLLLFTLYSMLDPAHFDSWHLIGITCRAIVDLGFHQDPPRAQNIDAAALDARRRTFYCAYTLDRAISMVHARAFSFTDDGINVALPSMIGVPFPRPQAPGDAAPGPGSAGHRPLNHFLAQIQPPVSPSSLPPSANPALLLFNLRRAQSHWYQSLYQDDPSEPLPDSSVFVWRMCTDMREWSEALPAGLPAGIREMFELELQYSYVYCIAPNSRAPLMTAYGRMLIFEHVIAFVDGILAATSGPINIIWQTYHDALRVFFMGSQFVAVLRDAPDAILAGGGSVPVPLALPGEAAPPPMPVPRRVVQSGAGGGAGSGSDLSPAETTPSNVQRAIACIERIGWVLSAYGARWVDAEQLAAGFEVISRTVLEDLWSRQAAANRQNGTGGGPGPFQQHPQQMPSHLHSAAPPMTGMNMSTPQQMIFPQQQLRQQQSRPLPMHYAASMPPHARQ